MREHLHDSPSGESGRRSRTRYPVGTSLPDNICGIALSCCRKISHSRRHTIGMRLQLLSQENLRPWFASQVTQEQVAFYISAESKAAADNAKDPSNAECLQARVVACT
jgi:hypothetical protein